MMKEILLRVERRKVFGLVELLTSYLGSKRETLPEREGSYDRLRSVEADDELLDVFFDECCGVAESALGCWMTEGSSAGEETWAAKLEMPDRFNDAVSGALEEAVITFFVEGVTGKWLMVSGPEEAQAHVEKSAASLETIKRLLVQRVRPKTVGQELVNK